MFCRLREENPVKLIKLGVFINRTVEHFDLIEETEEETDVLPIPPVEGYGCSLPLSTAILSSSVLLVLR